jgi:hypothetical protein
MAGIDPPATRGPGASPSYPRKQLRPLAKLPDALARQLDATPETGDGYRVVVLRLWDGREFGGVGIVDGEIIRPPVAIQTREVVAIGLETGQWLSLDEADRPE